MLDKNKIKQIWHGSVPLSTIELIIREGYFSPTYTEDEIEEWLDTFVGAFVAKYPRRVYVIGYLIEVIGKLPTWDDFTRKNLKAFHQFIIEKVSPNSANEYMTYVKCILGTRDRITPVPYRDFRMLLTTKGTPSIHIYLDEKEIQLIHDYQPRSYLEEIVKAQFLIGCYTGARHSDVMRLTVSNINQDGFLSYVSQKTKTQTTVFAHEDLAQYIKTSNNMQIATKTFSITIKAICRNLKIKTKTTVFMGGKYVTDYKWKFVSSHTARRSFASNLYLRNCEIAIISRMMGHSNINMTMKYIIPDLKIQEDKVMEYFKSK